MPSIDTLIDTLATSLVPVRHGRFLSLCLRCFGGLIVYVIAVLLYCHLRDDIIIKMTSLLYLFEIASLCAMTVTATIALIFLSYPDIRGQRIWLFLPIIPLFSLVCVLVQGYDQDTFLAVDTKIECLICIILFSIVPVAWLFIILKRQATVYPSLSGTYIALVGMSIGAMIVRLEEKTDAIPHLIQWHYIPMLICGGIGFLVGKKILSW
jgi:hypothetical protein